MTCSNRVTVRAGAFVILLAQACGFSPTTSFSGFDSECLARGDGFFPE